MTPDDVLTASVTCEGAPVQIEGQLRDGRFFYFRARHRTVSLGVGATPTQAVGATIPADEAAVLAARGEDTVGGIVARREFDRGNPEDRHPASWLEDDERDQLFAELLGEIPARDGAFPTEAPSR